METGQAWCHLERTREDGEGANQKANDGRSIVWRVISPSNATDHEEVSWVVRGASGRRGACV
jgi:hypothetical protein